MNLFQSVSQLPFSEYTVLQILLSASCSKRSKDRIVLSPWGNISLPVQP